jgi:hypothetical protein
MGSSQKAVGGHKKISLIVLLRECCVLIYLICTVIKTKIVSNRDSVSELPIKRGLPEK